MSDRPNVARIVHLQGGLRAIDVGSEQVSVQVHSKKRFHHFPTPDYPNLYTSLKKLGFEVIGVEFISGPHYVAPDWCFSPPEGGFKLMEASRAWREMRHLGYKKQRLDIVDVSRKCTALLELLGIRLLQLSNAYNGAYLAQAENGPLLEDHLFDNTYVPYIEAAIHAFLTDATNLRDFLFEFVWTYVLQEGKNKGVFKKIQDHPKRLNHPVAVEIAEEGEHGWLKRLTDLRNDVVHVAPIGAHHTFPSCHTRCLTLPDGNKVLHLSYGLVDRTSIQLRATGNVAPDNEELMKEELAAYMAQVNESEDALEYAWRTLGKLISLCEAARVESGLKGEIPTFTTEDLVTHK